MEIYRVHTVIRSTYAVPFHQSSIGRHTGEAPMVGELYAALPLHPSQEALYYGA